MLPNELVMKIYDYDTNKYGLTEVFPFLQEMIPNCLYCKNKSHFILKFEQDDSCRWCDNNITISDNIYICNLNCPQLYYDIDYGEINIKPNKYNNYYFEAELLCEKDDCYSCGRRIMYGVIAKGHQIKKLQVDKKEKEKNKTELKIQEFLDKKILIDENYKIKVVNMIILYNKYFNYKTDINSKKTKKFNRYLNILFSKKFKEDDGYYIGCKYNPN